MNIMDKIGSYKKFSQTIFILSILFSNSLLYTITSNCNSCLSTSTSKYCSPYEDSPTGYCCDSTSLTDFCG